MKIFETSKKCLPPAKRPTALPYSAIQWALHSDSQDGFLPLIMPQSVSPFPQPCCSVDRMLNMHCCGPCLCVRRSMNQPPWAVLRELGVPLWLKSDEALRVLVEKCAKAQVPCRWILQSHCLEHRAWHRLQDLTLLGVPTVTTVTVR